MNLCSVLRQSLLADRVLFSNNHTFNTGIRLRPVCDQLLDESTYDRYWKGVSYGCDVCGKRTNSFAQLKSVFLIGRLCQAHLNRASLSNLFAHLIS